MHSNDATLLERWRSDRDPSALAELVARHSALVFSTCRRILGNVHDAEDVAQDCFLELMRGTIAVRGPMAPLLHTLAVRRARDRIRSDGRRRARESRVASRGSTGRDKDRATDLEADEVLRALDEALLELPSEVRDLLVARFLEGRTNEAIAEQLGIAESTVRHRVEKGVAEIRAVLSRRGFTATLALVTSVLGGLSVEAAPAAMGVYLRKLALAGGSSLSPAGRAVALAGALAMKKVVVAASIAVVVLGACLFLASPFGIDRWSSSRPDDARSRATVERDGRAAGDIADADHGERGAGESTGASGREGVRVAGIVRDTLTGAPLSGATVRSGDGRVVQTSADGRFDLEANLDGEATVTASFDGYVASVLEIDVDALRAGDVPTNDDASATAPAIVIELSPALSVVAIGPDERRIPGAEIYLMEKVVSSDGSSESAVPIGPYRTGDDGRATIDVVPRVRPEASRVERVVFALADGDPVLSGLAENSISPQTGGAPASVIRVDLTSSVLVRGKVRVPADYDATTATVRIAALSMHDPRSIFGPTLLRSRDDRDIFAELFERSPDVDGEFTLAWVPRGASVHIEADGPALGRDEIRSANPGELEGIVFDLSAEGVMEGTLRFRSSGAPASGFVLVASLESHSSAVIHEAVADSDGRFRFGGLRSGAYVVSLPADADPSRGTLPVASSIEVGAGEIVDGLDLLIEEGAIVRGQVRDAETGEGIGRVGIRALQGTSGHERPVGGAESAEDGRFELRLPSGRARIYLAALPAGYRRPPEPEEHEVEIGVESGLEALELDGIDFEVQPGEEELPAFLRARSDELGYAIGFVVDDRGSPVENAVVEAHREWQLEEEAQRGADRGPWINPTHRATTDASGRYRLPVAAEKPYKVLATGPVHGSSWSERFEADADGEVAIEMLTIRVGTAEIAGVVVDPTGAPIANAEISISSKEKETSLASAQRTTDATGRFRAEHLLADEPVRVTILRAGYERRAWLVAPGTTDLRLVLPARREANSSERSSSGLEPMTSLVGKPAPELAVDWAREPGSASRIRAGDRAMVVLFGGAPSDWDVFASWVTELGRFAGEHDAVAAVILAPEVHESLVEWRLAGAPAGVGIGIDRFLSGSDGYSPGTTSSAYGSGESPAAVVIDARGAVIHVVRSYDGVDGLREAFANP